MFFFRCMALFVVLALPSLGEFVSLFPKYKILPKGKLT